MPQTPASQLYECLHCGFVCEAADMDVNKRSELGAEEEWSLCVCPKCKAWNTPLDEHWVPVAPGSIRRPDKP